MVIASINTSDMILVDFWDERLMKTFAEELAFLGAVEGWGRGKGLVRLPAIDDG